MTTLTRSGPIKPSLCSTITAVDSSPENPLEKGSGPDTSPHPFLTWRSVVMGLLISMGGLIFGYDTGQISGFLAMDNFLERFGEYDPVTEAYSFSNVRAGLIVGMLSIGNLIGALIGAPVANRYGRKPSISFWSGIFVIGVIVQIASSTAWYQIVIGRVVGGLGVGALSILVPLYQSESAPTHIRGPIVCLYQLFITCGILFANIINFGTHSINSSAAWRIPMGVGFLWAIILGVGILFFPESPKFVYRLGRVDDARKTMTKLLGVPETHEKVAKELREMKEKLEAEQSGGKQKWREIFTAPRMAYRTALGVALMAFQQLTGANFFFYYGTTLFAATGLDNSYVTQIILGTVNLVCTLPGLYFVEKFGRRQCLVLGGLWMCVCFLIFASVGHFADPTTPVAGSIMIVFACLFIAAFASTWGPMVWGVTAELFPARYRAIGMAISTASNWIFNFYIAFATPFITTSIDYAYGYVFAACCAAAAATVHLFVLESKGRTLEELDTMYVQGVKPWESGRWTATTEVGLFPLGNSQLTGHQLEADTNTRVGLDEERTLDRTPAPAVRTREDAIPGQTEMAPVTQTVSFTYT